MDFMERYHKDPLFRKNHLEAVKKYKKRKAEERKRQKAALKIERKVWRLFSLGNNEKVKCCRITYLAATLGRTSKRLREWEQEGKLPKTIRYKNHRYYTFEHFNMIVAHWNRYKDDLSTFFAHINSDWDKVLKKKM